MSIVLMYHALYRGEDTSAIEPEDLPYAVSEDTFVAHLDRLQGRRVGMLDSEPFPDVVITFDDGHQSNLEIAAPLLIERGLSALFFVTSGFIDTRDGFMRTGQLRELANLPGMQIGSHGVSHRFFDDLSVQESQQELQHSREQLQQITGQRCDCISFPGGRYHDKTLEQLVAAGYRQWYGSHVGIVDAARSLTSASDHAGELLSQRQRRPLSRVAVRRTTPLEEFERMITADRHYFRQHQLRSQAKNACRRLLGNRLYHGLYKSLSAR